MAVAREIRAIFPAPNRRTGRPRRLLPSNEKIWIGSFIDFTDFGFERDAGSALRLAIRAGLNLIQHEIASPDTSAHASGQRNPARN